MEIKLKLKPFQVPNFVLVEEKPGLRQGGLKPSTSWPISELEEDVISELCDEFRKGVFNKAGKNDPNPPTSAMPKPTFFTCNKERLVEFIKTLGNLKCCYGGGPWPRNCDCKYGWIPSNDGQISESTGCPELATLLYVVENCIVGEDLVTAKIIKSSSRPLISDEEIEYIESIDWQGP